ncbi:MAG: hypothetical protein Q4F44_08085, partial [Bacteroidales bacterium]|nr:hypothetical protein [Bacteroidales bacterium]
CVLSLTTNKRSTLCVLSLPFVAKCSHKLGELPAGVRGMDVVVFVLSPYRFTEGKHIFFRSSNSAAISVAILFNNHITTAGYQKGSPL